MYTRRRHQRGCTPLFILILILWLIGIGAGFLVFQNARQSAQVAEGRSQPTVAVTPRPSLQPTPESEIWIVSEKASLLTTIVPLYFDQNANWNVLALGQHAGHLQGTPNIGEGGNYVLAGHVELKDGTLGPFAHLNILQAGDPISIYGKIADRTVTTQYVVTEVKEVDPQDISVIRNHGQEELTLVTCKDWDAATNQYATRLIVHARPVIMNMGLSQ